MDLQLLTLHLLYSSSLDLRFLELGSFYPTSPSTFSLKYHKPFSNIASLCCESVLFIALNLFDLFTLNWFLSIGRFLPIKIGFLRHELGINFRAIGSPTQVFNLQFRTLLYDRQDL